MAAPRDPAARLRAEAERCERIATGLSDPELIARLGAWAREYRREARRLATSLHRGTGDLLAA